MDLAGALADVVDAIKIAGGVDEDDNPNVNVTADPGKLRLPGILVQLAGVDLDTLQGGTVQVRVLAIGNQRDDPRVVEQLETLLDVVLDADLEVSGPITTRGVQVPKQPHPMPALTIPVNVHQE